MGTINIYSGNGSNKAGLTYNGSGDITVDTEHLANTSSGIQSQLDTKLPLTGGTMTGELGIGVTPGAWSSNYPALQIGQGATFTGHASNTQTQLGQNWWIGTANQYVVDGAASRMIMNPDSTIIFSQAPSGTAGATMSTTHNRLVIDSSGRVGIGTTSPSQNQTGSVVPKLHVKSTGTTGAYDLVARFEAGTDASTTGASILINHANDRGLLIEAGRANGGDIGVAHFGVTNSGGVNTRAITILATGSTTNNVGIGTSVPTDKFEIHHNDAYEFSLKFNQGNNNIVSGFGQQQSILAYADGASNTDQYYAGITFGLWDATHNSKDGSIHFHTAVDGTVTTGLRITGTGEVLAALEPTLNMAVGTTNASHAKLTVYSGMGDKPALLLSNADGGANAYANRQNRYLTSNGTNWIGDGRDPIAVIASSSASTQLGVTTGLVMHNDNVTDNAFSPPIMFGTKSVSAGYNTAYGYIAGRKTGTGVDTNWSIGELWIDTAGTKHNGNNQYMDNSPAIKVRTTGTVDMRWQPFSYGQLSGNGASTANGTGWAFSPITTQGLSYNTNAAHGPGFTVVEAGYYQCFATGLYAPGGGLSYVYIGWCINGTQIHHWHSNHGIESNHDFVSSIIRWCNAGDHITLENSSANVTSQWGGTHSQYHIWKLG
jgi:hypothetical protein